MPEIDYDADPIAAFGVIRVTLDIGIRDFIYPGMDPEEEIKAQGDYIVHDISEYYNMFGTEYADHVETARVVGHTTRLLNDDEARELGIEVDYYRQQEALYKQAELML